MNRSITTIALSTCLLLLAPVTGAGAATTTFGAIPSDYSGPNVGCAGCNFFSDSSSATPGAAAPFDGTITAFHMRTGDANSVAQNVRPYIVRSNGDGSFKMIAVLDLTDISASDAHSTATIPANIAVEAGDRLGLYYSTTTVAGTWSNGGTTTAADHLSSWQGSMTPGTDHTPTAGLGTTQVNLLADLTYTPADPPQTPGPTPDTSAPVINSLKSLYSKFRVNPKGSIAAKLAPKGGGFQYVVSEVSTGAFTISRAVKKNGKTSYKKVSQVTTLLSADPGSIKFSGRYRDAKKRKKVLSPGRYRVTLIATDAAGNASAPRSAGFTIVK